MRIVVAGGAGCSAKPAEPARRAPTAPAAPAVTAKPAGESWLEGSFELGYRWIPNISGNFDAYRSVVNLGEGPKLLDADFTLRDPKKRVFDRADVHATSWGGDPYNTLRVDIQKDGWYRLTADYRNIAYFNFLPSYADPTMSQGLLLDQNSFDTAIRTTERPARSAAEEMDHALPRVWAKHADFGRGITVFHTDRNEYPVASLYSDQTDNFRGGVRMELGRYHVTLEQGGTTFKDDQGASDVTLNPGNFTGLF